MKKALFMTMLALGVSAFLLTAQDPAKFNGTWKGDKGQVRKLNVKDGVVYMEEQNTNGLLILRQYPFQGQEITMHDGVWADSKATGKMDGSKMVVDTTMPTGMKWHDEWTMAPDGKSYSALRQLVDQGGGFPNQKGGAPKAAPTAPPPGGGQAKAKAKAADEPETFTKVN
ncbi:MAG: hypothetical protein ABIR70_08250 [Bryobacteraceae bacterium]